MRQIGVRDEAKLLADYGDCGKPVCCNTHLSEMPPVSMKMAKLQRATLDPSKISGRCGRLKCCLRYEYDTYQDLQRDLPPVGADIITNNRPRTRAGPGNPRRPGAGRNRRHAANRHRRRRRAHRAQTRRRSRARRNDRTRKSTVPSKLEDPNVAVEELAVDHSIRDHEPPTDDFPIACAAGRRSINGDSQSSMQRSPCPASTIGNNQVSSGRDSGNLLGDGPRK